MSLSHRNSCKLRSGVSFEELSSRGTNFGASDSMYADRAYSPLRGLSSAAVEKSLMADCKHSILVVDDDPSLRDVMESFLTREGYTVHTADHGLNALWHMNNAVPELIISDLNMPHMSGFEFLPIVRHRFPQVAIIATSGAFTGEQVPVGVTADMFYEKGSSIKSLLGMIDNLISKTPTQKAHARESSHLRN